MPTHYLGMRRRWLGEAGIKIQEIIGPRDIDGNGPIVGNGKGTKEENTSTGLPLFFFLRFFLPITSHMKFKLEGKSRIMIGREIFPPMREGMSPGSPYNGPPMVHVYLYRLLFLLFMNIHNCSLWRHKSNENRLGSHESVSGCRFLSFSCHNPVAQQGTQRDRKRKKDRERK